jgi:lipid-A-disaccharide synthase
MKKTQRILIVAGEASGDGHAAKLVSALRESSPETEFEFFGAAGPKMREAGVEAIVRSDGLSIVGLAEIGRALPMFLRASNDLRRAARMRKPDAAILVDFPDFNLKLAKTLRKQGLCVIYYISPQLWAWRKYRTSTIRKYVDLMITILPFEKDWYAKHGVTNVEYVGSPLAREVYADRSKEEFCLDHGLDPSKPIISLLPGSRHKEIVRILPVMLTAAARIASAKPEVQFIVATASGRHRADVDLAVSRTTRNAPDAVKIVENETYDALNASDAAAVTSGTATLETGIIGTPMAIVYKTSALNYKLLEPMIDVPHYGLINLIAGRRIAAELVQNDFTAESLAAELAKLLDPSENTSMRAKLKAAADKLGHGGASKRAAAAILNLIDP